MVVIGIDLGTTNTLACYRKKDKPKFFKFDGGKMLPSVLYVNPNGSITIGHDARVAGQMDPANMIRSSKTYMGDPEKKYTPRGKTMTPTDVATEILREVKSTVLKKLNENPDTVVKAVITVPAYFSGKQKTETKKAGENAGLEVIRIISEPMAAAVAAGRIKELTGKILVVDIGGGTYDLCILEADLQAGDYKVVDTDGDRHLGGDDFDAVLKNYFLERLSENTGMDFSSSKASGLSATDYDRLTADFETAVEKTKKELSSSSEAEVSLTNLFTYKGRPYTFDIVVDREQFDEICEGLYEKISTRLKKFLERQPFPLSEISNVILAGGSCYTPRIRADVEKIVKQKVDTELDLDTLVVIGASIVAEHEASGVEAKGGYQDIISHSMGVEIIDDVGNHVLSKILEKGIPYPCKYTRPYTTTMDNQTSVDINIYEVGSDAEDIADINSHDLYGSLTLDGILPAPKGKPVINVTFSYDENQTLKVTAEDAETHVRKQILIRENQKVAIQSRQMPVDFMLLLDASSSMGGQPMKEAQSACNALVDGMIDFSVHRLGLISFESDANLLLNLSQNQKDLHDKINSIRVGGATNMIDAFEKAGAALRNSTNSKVVIIVSDGHPWLNYYSYFETEKKTLDAANKLRENNVRIVAIGVGKDIGESFLRKLANEGDAYKIDSMSKLEKTFGTVIHGIVEKK